MDWIVKKERKKKSTGTLRCLSHALDPLGFGVWQKLWASDSHVGGEIGVKTIVYNTKNDSKEGTQEKRLEKGKKENEQKVEEIQQ